jgi:hypothetical protein
VSELLVYLDHADWSTIADDTADDVELLIEAVRDASASFVISPAHLFDLCDAADDTRARWCDAIIRVARVVWFAEGGGARRLLWKRDHLEALLEDAEQFFGDWRKVKCAWLEPRRIAWEAATADSKHDRKRKLPTGRKLAALARHAAAEPPLAPLLEGADIDALIKDLTEPAAASLARGDLGSYVRRRRLADKLRPPADGDLVDEMHLAFVPYVDVFTVDANVADILKGAAGVPIALPPTANHDGRAERHCRYERVGRLADVASLVRRVADERGIGSEDDVRDEDEPAAGEVYGDGKAIP